MCVLIEHQNPYLFGWHLSESYTDHHRGIKRGSGNRFRAGERAIWKVGKPDRHAHHLSPALVITNEHPKVSHLLVVFMSCRLWTGGVPLGSSAVYRAYVVAPLAVHRGNVVAPRCVPLDAPLGRLCVPPCNPPGNSQLLRRLRRLHRTQPAKTKRSG